MSRATRGQNLVLMCLTMLFLVLMVLVTLGIATRVRDRMEAQMAADSAAYTQGVFAARTFNQTSLLNRTQLSLLVAFAGSESLMSWSGHYRSNLGGTKRALQMVLGIYQGCCNPFCYNPCFCANIPPTQAAIQLIQQEQLRVQGGWDQRDRAAGDQAKRQMHAAENIGPKERGTWMLLQARVERQLMANVIAGMTSDDLFAKEGGDQKSRDELAVVEQCDPSRGSACYKPRTANHHMNAMMGSRGWTFVTARTNAAEPMIRRITEVVQPSGMMCSWIPAAGRGGFGWGGFHHAQFPAALQPTNAWADDDEGMFAAVGCPCGVGGVGDVQRSYVRTNDASRNNDEHRYEGADSEPPSQRHTTQAQMFYPAFYDYNHLALTAPNAIRNDFGQPKLYSIIGRDYSQPRRDGALNGMDPWNLFFRYRFSAGGSDEERVFDNFSQGQGDFQSLGRARLDNVVSPSASIVYYHRPDVWQEPPNFFNPFWRTTLVAPDRDLHDYVRKTAPEYREHADTLRDLMANGMKGFAVRPGEN